MLQQLIAKLRLLGFEILLTVYITLRFHVLNVGKVTCELINQSEC